MSEEDQNKSNTVFATGHDGSTFEIGSFLTRDVFDDMLVWASNKKASDTTLQSGLPVVSEIAGMLIQITNRPISHAEIDDIVRYVYGENGPAELASGFDLDPSHEVRIYGEMKRFRINITGGRSLEGNKGIQMTIRSLPAEPIHVSKLNVEQAILDNFRPAQGLVLVTGPTGSGKSTLLSSCIRMIVEQPEANEKILEYSAPIEYVYDGLDMPSSIVHQTHAGRDLRPRGVEAGDEQSIFAYCVRNALRRKPTIIIVGEARDRATIEASVEAGLTGHLVYTTMHTIGVGETLRRAVMPFPDSVRAAMAVDIMESLRMIVSQLLLPRKGGGKVGCREYMVFSRDAREAFLKEPIDNWPRVARRLLAEERVLGQTMSEGALNLLWEDLIDEETYELIAGRSKAA